jgi:hypothetical protein
MDAVVGRGLRDRTAFDDDSSDHQPGMRHPAHVLKQDTRRGAHQTCRRLVHGTCRHLQRSCSGDWDRRSEPDA